jgi:periplasmic copper chaperone A
MNRLLALLLLLPLPALAGELLVEDAWIRAAPPGARMLAAYAVIENRGEAPRKLLGASSDRFGLVEMHRTVHIDGVARMREVESVEIPAGGEAALEPGGLHLMLMRPVSDVTEGETIVFELRFDQGETQRIDFVVRPRPK